MSRYWLTFVATLVILVATKENIKPHLIGINLCHDKLSSIAKNSLQYPQKSCHDKFMSL